ncbi:unnamed protein product [Allacma fusca]|uniref:Uncharacterized protein n=1 Tax=Allacma fusca TaxID=39272 RepID=A0A8J2IXU9_9HEXA|nr:unnamed protein product [Allacma fusca]
MKHETRREWISCGKDFPPNNGINYLIFYYSNPLERRRGEHMELLPAHAYSKKKEISSTQLSGIPKCFQTRRVG